MAKKKSIKIADHDEEFSQDVPDEEPARVIDEDEPDDDGGPGQSKTDLIREAVQAGYEKPALGVAYIKKQHGVEIDSKYYSIVKGKLGRRGDRPSGASAAEAPREAAATPAPARSAGAVPGSLFDDLKQLRDLKDRYGDDFEKMVEAIG